MKIETNLGAITLKSTEEYKDQEMIHSSAINSPDQHI